MSLHRVMADRSAARSRHFAGQVRYASHAVAKARTTSRNIRLVILAVCHVAGGRDDGCCRSLAGHGMVRCYAYLAADHRAGPLAGSTPHMRKARNQVRAA